MFLLSKYISTYILYYKNIYKPHDILVAYGDKKREEKG